MSQIRDELKVKQQGQRTTALAKYHAILLADDPAQVDQLQTVMASLDRTSDDVAKDRAYIVEARQIEAALAERPALSRQMQDVTTEMTARGQEIVAIKADLDAEMTELESRHGHIRDQIAELETKHRRLTLLRNDFRTLLDIDSGIVDLAAQALAGGGEPDAAADDGETPPNGGGDGPGGGPPTDGADPGGDGEPQPDVDPAPDDAVDEMSRRTVGGPVV